MLDNRSLKQVRQILRQELEAYFGPKPQPIAESEEVAPVEPVEPVEPPVDPEPVKPKTAKGKPSGNPDS